MCYLDDQLLVIAYLAMQQNILIVKHVYLCSLCYLQVLLDNLCFMFSLLAFNN